MAKARKANRFLSAIKDIGIVRIVFTLILGIIGACYAFALAVSGLTRTQNPQVALTFMPNESTALATKADQLFFANPQKPPRAVQILAMAALQEQAINPEALRLLGYYADVQGDTAKAEKLIGMAATLSRREIGSQLWLIESSARQNNTRQTLIHYDVALRTKPEVQTILFPRLLTAIDDREIRVALKPYIRGGNDWAQGFLGFANANSKNLPILVDLIVESGGLRDAKAAQSQELGLLSRLVSEKYFSDARRLFLQMPGATPAQLTSAAFAPTDRDGQFGAFGWQIIDEPDAGGGFSEKAGAGKANNNQVALSVFANSATTRVVASKLLYLKPGSYNFTAKLASFDRGDGGFLRWVVRCPSDATGAVLWSMDSISMTTRAVFPIADACPVQIVELTASGGKGQIGLEASIASIALTQQWLD
jgi:hypothetical protein